MANLFETLPTDVVLAIVGKLDSYGVLSFPEVFPSFKNITALVTDHSYDPLFFRVSGVERKLLPIPGTTKSSGLDIYTPKLARAHPIRLFDIHSNEPEVMRSVLELENTQDKLKDRQNVYFNSTTFVFIHTNYTCHPHELEALTRRLDEFTDCKWHVGLPTHFNDKNSMIISNQPRMKFSTKSLTSLRLVNVPVLEDCSFTNLRSLALIYTSSSCSDRPLVKGLRAPKLSRFVVHYTEKMPLFVDMGGVATLPFISPASNAFMFEFQLFEHLSGNYRPPFFMKYYGTCDHMIGVFELARIGRLEYRTRYAGKDQEEAILDVLDNEILEIMDTSFISRFSGVHLYGVPAELIKEINFMKTVKLRLQIGRESASLVNSDFRIKQRLSVLVVVLQEDNCVYPSFTSPFEPIIGDESAISRGEGLAFWLNIMGVKPRLAKLFEDRMSNDDVPKLLVVCIYSPTRLIRRVDSSTGCPVSPLTITHAEWACIMGTAGTGIGTCTELSLTGFRMPFLTKNPEVQSGLFSWGVPTCRRVTIRPVMLLDPREQYHQLTIDAMYLWGGVEGLHRDEHGQVSCIFTLSPLFEVISSVDTLGRQQYNRTSIAAGEYKTDITLEIKSIPLIHYKLKRGLDREMKMRISKQFTGFRWFAYDLVSPETSERIMGVNRTYQSLSPAVRDQIWRAIEPVASQSGVVNEWLFGYRDGY